MHRDLAVSLIPTPVTTVSRPRLVVNVLRDFYCVRIPDPVAKVSVRGDMLPKCWGMDDHFLGGHPSAKTTLSATLPAYP